MEYKKDDFLIATQALANYSPCFRTEGKSYKIKKVNDSSVDIFNDDDGYGTFLFSEMKLYFVTKTHYELWI